MQKALTLLALLSCSTMAIAQDGYSKLTGDMTITSKDYSDPPAGQTKDRVGFVLVGSSAKRMYDAMRVKPETKNVCEEGMRAKTAGPLDCTRSRDGSYTCMFAIMLTNGQSKPFGTC